LQKDQVIPDTSLIASPPLQPGRTYTWVVNGMDAQGTTLATLTIEFRVKQ